MKRVAIDGGRARLPVAVAASTPSVPIPPPALLERAKKLGAINAGPAALGMAIDAVPEKAPRSKRGAKAKAKGKKRRS